MRRRGHLENTSGKPQIRPIRALLAAVVGMSVIPSGCADDMAESTPILVVQEDDARLDTGGGGNAFIEPAPPDLVTYEIKRGGTLINVANLYKIHHHEIQALNPALDLEGQLSAGTRVAVYRRDPGRRSSSIGGPSDGSLEGGVPMLEGEGRRIYAQRYKAWASASTVAQLDRALTSWPVREPEAHPILVGNLSSRAGGRLQPHASHRSGRDVDLSFIQKWDGESEVGWQKMTAKNLDREKTWSFLKLLIDDGDVETVYIDYGVQKLLYEHASSTGLLSPRELNRWIEYPRAVGESTAIIRHAAGHADHLHVRYACRATDRQCR